MDGDIEYSLDGENWTKLGVVEGTDTLIKDLDVKARYVRVISTGYKNLRLRLLQRELIQIEVRI